MPWSCRYKSKSTNVKRSSKHKEQSSGKLPLIIVGCLSFLGVGLVGGGVVNDDKLNPDEVKEFQAEMVARVPAPSHPHSCCTPRDEIPRLSQRRK